MRKQIPSVSHTCFGVSNRVIEIVDRSADGGFFPVCPLRSGVGSRAIAAADVSVSGVRSIGLVFIVRYMEPYSGKLQEQEQP